jgi:hypothetical protein
MGDARREGREVKFEIFFDRETMREIHEGMQGEITAQEMDLAEKRKIFGFDVFEVITDKRLARVCEVA